MKKISFFLKKYKIDWVIIGLGVYLVVSGVLNINDKYYDTGIFARKQRNESNKKAVVGALILTFGVLVYRDKSK